MFKTSIMNTLIALAMLALIMPAQASSLVSTGDALAIEAGSLETRIEAFLLRDGVAAELSRHGVSHDMAMARVAGLSPEELELIAGNIDDAPAGAGLVYAFGIVFIVLIALHFLRR